MKVVLDVDDKFLKKYSEYDLKMYAAVGYYKARLGISTGDLAKMVGISRVKFIQEMGKYGEGILDAEAREIIKEIENGKR